MDVYDALIAERDAGHACALATIVNVQGSIPSHAPPGAPDVLPC